MPKKYIEAEELKAAIREDYNDFLSRIQVYRTIDKQQAADVVERKKGFWEWVDDMDYRCSVCQKYAYGCLGEVLSGHYKYCPYCGSAMEGEEDDEASGR